MQENLDERDDMQGMSVEDLFLNVQESYSEAQQRSIEESKSFAKTEFFRMDKLGVYGLRILPLAPNQDGTIERKSSEPPERKLLLELEKPGQRSKPMVVA